MSEAIPSTRKYVSVMDRLNSDARARLTAAAPELLGVLMELDERLRRCISVNASARDAYDSSYQDMVKAAIAKATA